MTRPSFSDLFNSKPINPINKEETFEVAQSPNDHDQIDPSQKATKLLSSLDTKKLSYTSLATQELSHSITKPHGNLDTDMLSHSIAQSPSNQVKGYFLPNWIQDELLPTLELAEQATLLRIIRLTLGFNKQITDSVGLSKLAEKCNLSQSGLKKALKSLESRNLIKIYSDLSRNAKGGNKYELVINHYSTKKLSHPVAKSPSSYNKDDDDPLKKQDHHQSQATNNFSEHQKQVMMIYQQITENSWTKADAATYEKIKNIPLDKVETAIKLATQRASSRPNSLAFFTKEILSVASPKQNRSKQKKLMEKIVDRVRNSFVGSNYSMSDFVYKVKEFCLRDDVAFDNDLLDEIMAKKHT